MGITFSHQTTSNDFARKKIHRLNLDLVVKEREIRLKEVARIAAVEAASVKKAEWEKSSAQLPECSTVVQTLKADRDLLGKDIEIAQLEGEIEKLQHSAIVSKEKQNELESSNRALRKQLQTLSEGIDKAGGISANSFLNTVEKLECRISNLEESNNALSTKIFLASTLVNLGGRLTRESRTTSMDKCLWPRKRAP
jgi:chromosome segregation ATPase